MFIINFCLNMFRASLRPSSGDQRPRVTVLVLLDVVGSGCGALRFRMRALLVYEFLYARIHFSWNMTPGTDVAKEDTVFIFKGLKVREENL
jgi:hypothetical protein